MLKNYKKLSLSLIGILVLNVITCGAVLTTQLQIKDTETMNPIEIPNLGFFPELLFSKYEAEIQNLQTQISDLEDVLLMEDSSDWHMTNGIATAYSPYDDRNGIQSFGDPSITSIGLTPGPKIMAVDPKKIPYYSEIIVICPDGTVITGMAGDTGGALRNNPVCQVDIFKQTFEEAVEFARKDVVILWKEKSK